MEYIEAVNGVLLYGSLLMQSCGEDSIKRSYVLKSVNEVLKEFSYVVLEQNMVITDKRVSNSLQKLMDIK